METSFLSKKSTEKPKVIANEIGSFLNKKRKKYRTLFTKKIQLRNSFQFFVYLNKLKMEKETKEGESPVVEN